MVGGDGHGVIIMILMSTARLGVVGLPSVLPEVSTVSQAALSMPLGRRPGGDDDFDHDIYNNPDNLQSGCWPWRLKAQPVLEKA